MYLNVVIWFKISYQIGNQSQGKCKETQQMAVMQLSRYRLLLTQKKRNSFNSSIFQTPTSTLDMHVLTGEKQYFT